MATKWLSKTYMSDQGLDQFMSVGHVSEVHKEVILRGTEQVGAEHD